MYLFINSPVLAGSASVFVPLQPVRGAKGVRMSRQKGYSDGVVAQRRQGGGDVVAAMEILKLKLKLSGNEQNLKSARCQNPI